MTFSSCARLAASLLLPALATCLPAFAQLAPRAGPVVGTPHVRAELVAHAPQGVGAGRAGLGRA